MRNLFADYVQDATELSAFFAHSCNAFPKEFPREAFWPAELVADLKAYQEELGTGASFTGKEQVVITGQQPGLFTGPLYTLYKAATAIVLARRLETQSGVPHVPVFWVASDDHDFEESRTAHLYTKTHDVCSITYAPEGYLAGQPMYQVPIEDSLHDLVDEAAAITRGAEMRDEITRFLHDSIAQSTSLSNWTARLLARLFRDTPLVLFTPELPAARRLARSVFARELSMPLVSTTLINETGQRLRQLGYVQQIAKHPTECCFFLAMGDRRRKVLYEKGAFVLPEEHIHLEGDALQQLLQEDPGRFSPNAALRCIVQQCLFPVRAYIAGPGELAYWAQLKPVFEHFGQSMPVVYPRAQGVLLDEKAKRHMERFQFNREDLLLPPEQLVSRALQSVAHTPSLEVVRRYRSRVSTILEPLHSDLAVVNKQATQMADKMTERIEKEFDRLEQGLAREDAGHVEVVRNLIARLAALQMPFRRSQERVLTVFSFLFEYGWDLVPRLIEAIDVDTFAMKEIVL